MADENHDTILAALTRAVVERFAPERIVLFIIGALANRMAPVLWVIMVLSNLTVFHRVVHTYRETQRLNATAGEP